MSLEGKLEIGTRNSCSQQKIQKKMNLLPELWKEHVFEYLSLTHCTLIRDLFELPVKIDVVHSVVEFVPFAAKKILLPHHTYLYKDFVDDTLSVLQMPGNTTVKSLELLSVCTNLITLNFHSNDHIKSVTPLNCCKSLTELNLWHARLTTLEPLKGLNLKGLYLNWSVLVSSIEPLKEHYSMECLVLGRNRKIKSISAIQKLTNLQRLDLNQNKKLAEIRLDSSKLRYLDLCMNKHVKTLEHVRFDSMIHLDLSNNTEIESLEPLRNCKTLKHLNLTQNDRIESIEPLRDCALIRLYMSKNTKIESIDSLNCSNMICLRMDSNNRISSLNCFANCKLLTLFSMESNEQVTDFSPLDDCKRLFKENLSLFNSESARRYLEKRPSAIYV